MSDKCRHLAVGDSIGKANEWTKTFYCYSGSQNNLHCSCNGTTSNGAAATVCTGGVLARKVPNHSGASPGQSNKKPAVSLTHLPKRPPVDVEFKNLAYSVSEGRKRGKS